MYVIEWSEQASAELNAVRSFHRPPIRVFYFVEGETVRILGVKLKGTRTTGEIL
jgi:hypothetical protein